MPIELSVKVEQMNLDGSPGCSNDRRTNADVADAIHNRPIYHSSHRIHPIAGEQFHGIGDLDICCRETKASSHLVPGDDDPLDGVETPEEPCCAFHITFRNGRADNRTGARFPVNHHWSNDDESAPRVVEDSGHHLRIAGAALTKMEIPAYDNNTRIQATDKDLTYEGLCRQSLETSREILEDNGFDPGLLSQFNTLAVRRQETLDTPSR